MPLEENSNYRERLSKIVIEPSSFCNIRDSLDRCGINRSTLFPDMDGLCTHLTWSNSISSDEGSEHSPSDCSV